MRVVFDSNVLIAAFATHGLCHPLFEACVRGHEVFVSARILDEVEKKLIRKIRLPPAAAAEVREYLESHCKVEVPLPVPPDACRDRNDLHVLGAAIAARAEYLATGDDDLLELRRFRETEIVTPRQLYEALRRSRS